MIIPNNKALQHKNQLLRTLRAILKDNVLANSLIFKGGTYAALRGSLDRFSVDLDFDILPISSGEKAQLRERLHSLFADLRLDISDESRKHLQFFLKYDAAANERNTLKVEINDQVSQYNEYEKVFLQEITMYCTGHSLGTMFANKMIAAKARYDEGKRIAGRDYYDLHYFFMQGYSVNVKVVEDLSGLTYSQYLQDLIAFIEQQVDNKQLLQDLNPLLPARELKFSLEKIKPELLFFLRAELQRDRDV